MKTQLGIKTLIAYFIAITGTPVKVKELVKTFPDYNATNIKGNTLGLVRKGWLSIAEPKFSQEATLRLTEKGENIIAKKTFCHETI